MIAGAIGYFAFDVAALAAAFHAVGSAGLPIGLLVLAYTLGHGGALVPIPGSAEGGLIGMFVLYGMSVPTATAAVLAYRALHAGVPMLLGAIGLADVRRLLRAAQHQPDLDSSGLLGHMSAITDLYAGVPVSDLDASIDWYTRFFGRPPDMRAGEEVLWKVKEHAWVFIEPNAPQAGAGRITLAMAGLDALLEHLAAQASSTSRSRPTRTVSAT